MYEEVEINTKKELAEHLMNKGELYVTCEKYMIHFCDDVGNQPFLFQDFYGVDEPIKKFWDVENHTFYKKLNWHDCIPEGKKVPCYVNDSDPTLVGTERGICKYVKGADYPYRSDTGRWKYATPIPADELWVPEL